MILRKTSISCGKDWDIGKGSKSGTSVKVWMTTQRSEEELTFGDKEKYKNSPQDTSMNQHEASEFY